ncbi:MAG: lactoylglutathione lyase, partial [Candidatus Accumulibacter sp.]|nr:lactoylglutathione lyase [Accumulibacter sp.]
TAFTWVPESEAVGGRSLIRIDPRGMRGQVFEFEEA